MEEALGSLGGADGWVPARRARVLLDGAELVQERHLKDLPPVPVSALRNIVALQQTRFFRRNESPLVTMARQVSTDGAGRVIHAVAVEADLLEAVRRGLTRAGLRQFTVIHSGSGLELPVPSRSTERGEARNRYHRILLVAGIALWAVAAAIHAGRLVIAERSLTRRMTEFEEAERAIAAARRRMGGAVAVIATIDSARVRAPRIQVMVDRLTGALPDSAWMRSLTLRLHHGEISTKGAGAGIVRDQFARIPGVTDLVVEGAVAVEETGTETAMLRFRWEAP